VAQRSQDYRARRIAQYQQVLALHQEHWSIRQIVRQTGLNVHTVLKYVRADAFPERAKLQTQHAIDRFAGQLRTWWDAGERNAQVLHRKLGLLGFTGSVHMVTRCVAPWREPRRRRPSDPACGPRPAQPPPRRISSKRLSWLLLQDQIERKPDEQMLIDQLTKDCPPVRKAVDLAREFRGIFKERQPAKLLEWIDRAKDNEMPSQLKNFAQGLEQQWPSVKAAVELPWNNGRAEGHVNRIKLIKRQMYGRANFDLLRIRVMARAP
jgi:transposase